MTKKSILAITFSSTTVVLATGAMVWFQGTHEQNPIMFDGYRQLSDFAWTNVWWPMVGITFALMLALAFPWWTLALADDDHQGMPTRKFSLFPFMHMRGLDRLITMFNVFSILGVTISLMMLAQMDLQDFDPSQAEQIRLYLTSLLIFWGLVYFLVSFLMWRRRRDQAIDERDANKH